MKKYLRNEEKQKIKKMYKTEKEEEKQQCDVGAFTS